MFSWWDAFGVSPLKIFSPSGCWVGLPLFPIKFLLQKAENGVCAIRWPLIKSSSCGQTASNVCKKYISCSTFNQNRKNQMSKVRAKPGDHSSICAQTNQPRKHIILISINTYTYAYTYTYYISVPLTICGYPIFPDKLVHFQGKYPIFTKIVVYGSMDRTTCPTPVQFFKLPGAPGVVNNSSEKVMRPKSSEDSDLLTLNCLSQFKFYSTHGILIQ